MDVWILLSYLRSHGVFGRLIVLQEHNREKSIAEYTQKLNEVQAAIDSVQCEETRLIDMGCIEDDEIRAKVDPSGEAQTAHDDLRAAEEEFKRLQE